MWPAIITDQVTWSVGLSVTLVSPAKTAEAIGIPFAPRTSVGPENHVLDGVQIKQWEGEILRRKGANHCKVSGHSAVVSAKTAESIEMPIALWAQMGPTNREGSKSPMGRSNIEE